MKLQLVGRNYPVNQCPTPRLCVTSQAGKRSTVEPVDQSDDFRFSFYHSLWLFPTDSHLWFEPKWARPLFARPCRSKPRKLRENCLSVCPCWLRTCRLSFPEKEPNCPIPYYIIQSYFKTILGHLNVGIKSRQVRWMVKTEVSSIEWFLWMWCGVAGCERSIMPSTAKTGLYRLGSETGARTKVLEG